MAGDLEDRLRAHADSFNGLLALIPAKNYYGEDKSDQWQRKRQTKAEAKAAKRAKLDPANTKSVKEVMEENALKRKREEEGVNSETDEFNSERPRDGLKPTKKSKKLGQQDSSASTNHKQDRINDEFPPSEKSIAEKRKAKRERKQAAKVLQRELKKKTREKKKLQRETEDQLAGSIKQSTDIPDEESTTEGDGQVQLDPRDASALDEDKVYRNGSSSSASSSGSQSPAFDPPNPQSGTSSISSIVDPPSTLGAKKEAHSLKSRVPSSEARERLQKRIEALRAARKADNEDGSLAKSRQELMESRRRKEEQRKAHKKQLRQQAKEEERMQREHALANGSPLLSPSFLSPRGSHGHSPLAEQLNNFSYGRVSFDNGQSMSADLSTLKNLNKRKGPQDANTALEAMKKRESRISALDPGKRADVEEKELWLNARKRAHGERVRDDSSLLKKALKRKEKQKKRSEKDWNERTEGVAKGQAIRQQKREENLQKRREEKGSKGKRGNKGIKTKPKARPGFEGSFRTGGKAK